MTNLKTGVFISDIHYPDNINLAPVVSFINDLQPETIILGGDIIDAEGLHASESMKAEQVKMEWFNRDTTFVKNFIQGFRNSTPASKIVYLEGNHEQRYARLQDKYPDLFKETLNFRKVVAREVDTYVNYAQSDSYYKIGDMIFVHGDIFPDLHAKPYALRYSPNKVIYGHMHHFQAYTTHRALLHESPRYGVTAGCLSTLNPAWKKGQANQWVNGFVSFVTDGTTTTPTIHLIEKGRFAVGRKIYGGK